MATGYQEIAPRALRLAQVAIVTTMSKSQIMRLVAAGKFPKPVKLSEAVTVFDAKAVDDWLDAKFEGGP